MCPVKDFFNGTYLVCCTVDITFLSSYTISINQQFKGFDAYKPVPNKMTYVWSKLFTQTNQFQTSKTQPYPPCSNVTSLNLEHGYWGKHSKSSRRNNRFILPDVNSPGDHCEFPLMPAAQLKACFKNVYNNTLVMIGDSHVRYAYFLMIRLTTGETPWQGMIYIYIYNIYI